MDLDEQIRLFLDGEPFAVVGASTDREKYGNKVLRCYQQNQRRVIPVNPRAAQVEGLGAYPDLASVGESIHGVSIITPPAITEGVVEQAIELGIGQLWMQPGAESAPAIALAEAAGINVIHGGPCLLVVLGYHED